MPDVRIDAQGALLSGTLEHAGAGDALVIFAHGSGSGRRSPRNLAVAEAIRGAGLSPLLFDLLSEEEDVIDRATGRLRFDVHLLGDRLEAVTEWAVGQFVNDSGVSIGYFGASTGAAAALVAASHLGDRISAVVSRGGRPDLAGAQALGLVVAPTLLVVGERDREVLVLNQQALSQLQCDKDIEIVPGASHLFQEPGALEEVSLHAIDWFRRWLQPGASLREARPNRRRGSEARPR
jgi:pimeloyl-ACP methyl ester carboxylesterase